MLRNGIKEVKDRGKKISKLVQENEAEAKKRMKKQYDRNVNLREFE